jgi:hypothetical protein
MVQFYIADDGVHKYVAEFDNPPKLVSFGALGYEDYTQHHDAYRKKLYLNRHRKRENWKDPRTAGALSRWILWNKPSLEDSIHDYIKRFGMH